MVVARTEADMIGLEDMFRVPPSANRVRGSVFASQLGFQSLSLYLELARGMAWLGLDLGLGLGFRVLLCSGGAGLA